MAILSWGLCVNSFTGRYSQKVRRMGNIKVEMVEFVGEQVLKRLDNKGLVLIGL